MKKFIDENIKANEEAIIRENNGPELRVKLYDNTGIDSFIIMVKVRLKVLY